MMYYSTGGSAAKADLRTAVVRGLAEDRGLYMPERIPTLPAWFFYTMDERSFTENSLRVARAFFGEDVPEWDLKRIVTETLSFDCPIREVEPGIWSLELFHGPTLAFKDVGARFMARLLRHFTKGQGTLTVLVATSGDTGSAVANGFLGVEGIRVLVLYPKGKVSPIQECQFATLGRNVTALEVDGTFDDCQALVKSAFMDPELTASVPLTSANSINVARLLPQMFYYYHAYAQLLRKGQAENVVCCVPSGNFGNLCAALIARRTGLPIKRFIAANNANSVFYDYLKGGAYLPRPSVRTIANAMDVGDPSNFARILDLYGNDHDSICADIAGATYSDARIAETIKDCYTRTGYLLDPHGACGYRALKDGLREGETGFFCETAHPAKFKDTVEPIVGAPVRVPERLRAFLGGTKQSVPLANDYGAFRDYILNG